MMPFFGNSKKSQSNTYDERIAADRGALSARDSQVSITNNVQSADARTLRQVSSDLRRAQSAGFKSNTSVANNAVGNSRLLADTAITQNSNLAKTATGQISLLAGDITNNAFQYGEQVTKNANALIEQATRPQSADQTALLKNVGLYLTLGLVGVAFAMRGSK